MARRHRSRKGNLAVPRPSGPYQIKSGVRPTTTFSLSAKACARRAYIASRIEHVGMPYLSSKLPRPDPHPKHPHTTHNEVCYRFRRSRCCGLGAKVSVCAEAWWTRLMTTASSGTSVNKTVLKRVETLLVPLLGEFILRLACALALMTNRNETDCFCSNEQFATDVRHCFYE